MLSFLTVGPFYFLLDTPSYYIGNICFDDFISFGVYFSIELLMEVATICSTQIGAKRARPTRGW